MSLGRYWTIDELDTLRDLARGGTRTLEELSVTLCRSPSSVRRHAERLGLGWKSTKDPVDAPNRTKRDLKSQIEDLCDDGWRAADIARHLNASLDYTTYVANIHRAVGPGIGNVQRDTARDLKHLRAIAKSSNGRGFPYCLTAARFPPPKSIPVDKCVPGQIAQLSAPPNQRISRS